MHLTLFTASPTTT